MTNTLDYQIIHDLGKPLVFVGRSYHNTCLSKYFAGSRPLQSLSLEELVIQSDQWFQDHQFICVMSNVSFKQKIKNFLASKSADLFSVISKNSSIGHDVKIGRSTLINHMNVLYDDCRIGDFSFVTNFVMISHEVVIGNYCHISPYSYLCFCSINDGCYVGLRSSIFGYPDKAIDVIEYTNLKADSRLTRSVTQTGTYHGHIKHDDRGSLDLHL